MTLNRKRWLVRWFFWSLGIVDEFAMKNRTWRIEENGTSLCLFFQTIVVYAPLTLLWQLVVWALVVAAIAGAPIAWFGVWGYLSFVGVLGIIIGVVWGGVEYKQYRDRARMKHRAYREHEEPTSAGLLVSWFSAVKNKVCPLITFTAQESAR